MTDQLIRPACAGPRTLRRGKSPETIRISWLASQADIRDGGPMTFARFMDLALYDPEHGYYASGTRGPGRTGDFLTAPESHPIFGWTVARQLEEVWEAPRPSRSRSRSASSARAPVRSRRGSWTG